MAISFIAKKQRIIAEAKKKEAKPALKKLAEAIKNMNRLSGDEKEKLKELVNAVYEKFVEKPTPIKKGETEKPTKKPSRSISQILKEFKAKIGAEKWREATRGTDIYRDMERPALKKGKRIVRKKGKTSNQYGTFKNKVGGTYYESRTNRSDVNQPSDKRYPKLENGGEFKRGGTTGKKKIMRKKVTRQNANYDKKADSGLVGKPQGHRFTNKLAKRLGKTSYAKPTKEQVEKYRGRGVYSENRQDKSDVNPKKTYPSLGNGGMMFANGGLLEKIKKSDTISEKDILLMKRRMNANNNDTSVREVLDYYMEIGENPRLDAEQTKKGYDFLMNLWKSPTGKVRTNNPFSEREQKVLENFSHFEFEGFMNGQPVYIVMAKNGSSFEYYYSGGSMKIYADGGRTGKKRLKRKKVTRQNPNYDKKADSGLIGKPQGHRFTNKLAKRLGKTSYAKPTQEQIEKYRGKGIYSENRQDKSDVNPKKTYPSL